MCEWTTHTVAGGLLWVGGTTVASWLFGIDVAPAAVLVGTVVAMGASHLPDSDHRNAAIAHALGPVTAVPVRVVSGIFPHRGPTHYAIAVPVWAGLAAAVARIRLDLPAPIVGWISDQFARTAAAPDTADAARASLLDLAQLTAGGHRYMVEHGDWQLGLFTVVAFLCAWGLRALSTDLDRALEGAGEIAAGVAIAAAAFAWVPLGWWVPAAVAIGVLSHDLTDLLTKGPIRFLWPLPFEMSLGLFVTGHRRERLIAGPVMLVAAGLLLWVRAVQPLGEAAHVVLAALGL
jgi:hypothetical protein